MEQLEYIYNDGGRSKYFKGKDTGDCVVRSIAIAAQRDYKEVYDEAAKLLGYTPRNGIKHKDTRQLVSHFGGSWVSKMSIGQGCTTHLRRDEIPMQGRIICSVTGHLTAVIDGVINDTYDPSRDGNRCVYGYYIFAS